MKNDPRWAKFHNDPLIDGFGVPWGPYGFNSGVTQEDVSREEARELGLKFDIRAPGLTAGSMSKKRLTDGTQASTKGMDPALKAKLLAELRAEPSTPRKTPKDYAREAAAQVSRQMLNRGLTDAVGRGDSGKAAKYRKAIAELSNAPQGLAVTDDGDKNILEDGLSQRLSKVQKSDPSDAEKTAIARKIFESVDRKSAEPKTRKESKKGVNRSKHLLSDAIILTPEESQIVKSPIEILLVHTPDGRLKSVTLGSSNEVAIPNDVAEGSILSHNHPSGRGPSDADIKSVLSFPGTTLRVVGRNENGRVEVFSMKFVGNLKKFEILKYSELYFEQCDEGGDTHSARRESLALISQIIGSSFQVLTRIFQ